MSCPNPNALIELCYLCRFMNLINSILLSLAVAFLIIGIYEMMAVGVGEGYWAIMLSIALFFLYVYRKKK